MAVDLKKNKDALVQAYQQVQDNNDDTDWALYGYEGTTQVLKVVGTGDGGIDEMAEDLSAGKMMYAYCRVTDPNTSLPKYVLVHWTGESVPENLKLKYTAHLKDVQAFLKTIHILVPARDEGDIDAEAIIKKVAKSSGANYSFHKETAKKGDNTPAEPVGSNYKRTVPTQEINISNRDKFWAQTEKEEIARQNEEKLRLEAGRQKLDQERKDREAKETKEREKRISAHSRDIGQQRQAEKKAEFQSKEHEKRRWEQIQKESSIDEEERGHRSDQMRKERNAEAAALAANSASSARNFFKQKSVERPDMPQRGPPPPRKLQHNFGSSPPSEPEPPKQPVQLPREEEPPAKPVRQPEPEPEVQAPPSPQAPSSPPAASQPSPATNMLRQHLPQRQDSDHEEDDGEWDDEPPAQQVEDLSLNDQRVPPATEPPAAAQYDVSSNQYSEEVVPPAEEPPAPQSADTGEPRLRARALWDYQAADDTEITFDPDDIIYDIVQIDEGWWQGFAPDGSYGMFPANFVELIED